MQSFTTLCTSSFEDIFAFSQLCDVDAKLGVVRESLHPYLQSEEGAGIA